MKEKMLEQIGKELKVATWVDFVTMAIVVTVTLIFFGVAAGSANGVVTSDTPAISLGGILGGGGSTAAPVYQFNVAPTIIMFVALVLIALLNWYGIAALEKNKKQRAKLSEGLMKLLKDETLDQYHDGSIFKTYETRYGFFTVIMASVAALGVIVPVVIFINQLVTKL
jgi:hypothetical protein